MEEETDSPSSEPSDSEEPSHDRDALSGQRTYVEDAAGKEVFGSIEKSGSKQVSGREVPSASEQSIPRSVDPDEPANTSADSDGADGSDSSVSSDE